MPCAVDKLTTVHGEVWLGPTERDTAIFGTAKKWFTVQDFLCDIVHFPLLVSKPMEKSARSLRLRLRMESFLLRAVLAFALRYPAKVRMREL